MLIEERELDDVRFELPEGYQMRPARRSDLEEVVRMLNEALQEVIEVDFFSTSELGREWEMPGFDLQKDSQVVTAPDGSIIGYFDIFDLDEPHVRIYCYGKEHPKAAGQGVAAALIQWAEQRARQSISKAPPDARIVLIANMFTIDESLQRLYRASGFELIRHSLRMVIELDQEIPAPQWPDGISLRPFVIGRDDEDTILAVRESFADHWGFVERPLENELARYRHMWETDESFDPTLYFLALDGDQVAGISLCYSKVEEDPGMGWVGTLGVRRPWRRKGLGLALLLHSFHEFKRRGKIRVGLGVDAQSLTGATRLYEKAGMHSDPKLQWSIYEKELRPGIEISTQSVEQEA
jgi:mycothiol synthase